MPNPCAPLPSSLSAGDSLSFTRTLGAYPASAGWKLAYALVNATHVYNFSATQSGDGFAVALASSDTQAWAPGNYQLVEAVTSADDAQRFTTARVPFSVLVNAAGATGPADYRTHAQKMLDAIEAYFEKRTPTTYLILIDGKRLEHYPLTELLAMRDKYRAEVAREKRRASGRGAPRLLTRFSR